MHRMQRQMGVFLPRTADDHQVGMLIADFQAADKMLETLIEASKTWRDSWTSILTHQSGMLADFENLYGPIIGKDPASVDRYYATPQDKLERVNGLKAGYVELKNEMLEEVGMIEKQIVAPAKEARISVKAYMKVIKKREDKKLDWERYKSRTENLERKANRSDRENTALGKHQIDYASATAAYEAADAHLKETLPSITHKTYSLLPHLLNAQIMIQNTLLGQLYTVLQAYCGDFGFASDPPEANEIIRTFEADFNSLRIELESGIMTIARGKAVKEPMGGPEKSKSYSGLNIRNGIQSKRSASASKMPTLGRLPPPPASFDEKNASPGTSPGPAPQLSIATRPRIPSSNSYSNSYAKSPGSYLSPITSNNHRTPSPSATNQADYFAPASHTSSYNSESRRPSAASSVSLSSIASKKKPPPPPPKRIPSGNVQVDYVTALYDYAGQEGDLSFREGDRIRIVKKTGSTDDWWEGEVGGLRGQFPANYCR